MSSPSSCGNKEALVAYLYGECDAVELDAFEAHLLTCLTCATEVREMRGVRLALGEWAVPNAQLGFRIVNEPPDTARSPRWFWPVPVWAQAAAAAVFFVAGVAAMANLEVRYGSDGLVVRTGWGSTSPGTAGPADLAGTAAMPAAWRSEMQALADSLRGEFARQAQRVAAASHDDAAPPRLVSARSSASEAELMRRVAALIEQSEQRKDRELAVRLAQLYREVETNRRTDLARFQQGLGDIQGQTGRALTDQRDWMTNYVVRTASPRQPQ